MSSSARGADELIDLRRAQVERMEGLLSGLLRYGALLASAMIVLGLVAQWGWSAHLSLVTAGVVLIILLPVLRVALMMLIFLRQKDYPFAAISACVLGIILIGFVWGITHTGYSGE